MQVLEKLVCRFAPPFFSPWRWTDGRPAGRPANRSHQNLPKTDPTEGGREHSPSTRSFSFSHSLLSSRPVRDRSPRSLASLALSLSLPLACLSTARHAFPTHAHFDGPVVLNLKQGGLDPPLLLLLLLHIPYCQSSYLFSCVIPALTPSWERCRFLHCHGQ